eukprot:2799866-Pleurochrysis_carterae.AAC.2
MNYMRTGDDPFDGDSVAFEFEDPAKVGLAHAVGDVGFGHAEKSLSSSISIYASKFGLPLEQDPAESFELTRIDLFCLGDCAC